MYSFKDFNDLVSWLRAVKNWFSRFKVGGETLLGIIAAIVLALVSSDEATGYIRMTGLWLQFFGLGVAAYSIGRLQIIIGEKPWWKKFIDFITSFPIPQRTKKEVIVTGTTAKATARGFGGTVTVSRPESIPERITHLEKKSVL